MSSAVRHDPARSRFELEVDGATAIAVYRLSDGVMTFTHTETPREMRGRGIASRLIQGALEQARAMGVKVAVRCPFVGQHIARHPEFRDLLA